MPDILLLAGTAEARALAARLAEMPGLSTVASLAGATRAPAEYAVPVRTGGFGGAAGLAAWLGAEGIRAVIDATHPFAAQMPCNAARASATAGVPRLRLIRAAWPERPGWRVVGSADAAARALPAGARALLTTGHDFRPFAARADCRFWLRTIEPVAALPPHIAPILARPPFGRRAEAALLRRLAATHLVGRNSGGDPAKLDAAEALGVGVVIIARPAPPPGPVAGTVEQALAWLAGIVDAPPGRAARG